MAKGLGIAATAEGIETKEQLEIVRSEGCTEIQGFLISKPRPAVEIKQMLLSVREGSEKFARVGAA
jgi:EAL domain-containing protein (putative c-di-GMP-specific phosphodiesterase class I)